VIILFCTISDFTFVVSRIHVHLGFPTERKKTGAKKAFGLASVLFAGLGLIVLFTGSGMHRRLIAALNPEIFSRT
jgi:hypothetical protein